MERKFALYLQDANTSSGDVLLTDTKDNQTLLFFLPLTLAFRNELRILFSEKFPSGLVYVALLVHLGKVQKCVGWPWAPSVHELNLLSK